MTSPFEKASDRVLALPQSDGVAEDDPKYQKMLEHIAATSCGECQECCFVAEVVDRDLQKKAQTRCQHQCATGCAIYARKPKDCTVFYCLWRTGIVGGERPDKSGVLWWIGSTADGEARMHMDIDLARATDSMLANSFRYGEGLNQNGAAVLIRVRGDRFAIVRMASGGIGIFPDRKPGESIESQQARAAKLLPAAAARWSQLAERVRAYENRLREAAP